jgi:hypothetical protein
MKALLVPLLVWAGSSAGCGQSVSDSRSGSTGGQSAVPADHRAEAVACPEERGPGSATIVGECTRDSDCTDGINGRCITPNVVGPSGGSRCDYDTCFSDADCPSSQPCRCRRSAADSSPNYCLVESSCRIDSDCGPGGFCSPSLLHIDGSIQGGGSFGYFCHTPDDLCLYDSDCDPSTCELPSCAWLACGYGAISKRWECFRVGTH